MTINSSVGTTLKISASLPATNDRFAYAALPFTEMGEITDLELPVREYELKTHYPLTQRGAVKRKGNYNDGRMVVTLAVDDYDAGQILAARARDSDAYYSFKVTIPPYSAQYFQAQVMSFSTSVGSANNIVTGVVVLELDSKAGLISVADEDLIWAFDADTNSLVPTEGTGTPTFTRAAATATRVNPSGLIEIVAANTARFDYDPVTLAIKGLLIEEARTNKLLRSGDVSHAAWAHRAPATIGAAGVAPDGTISAAQITRTAGTTKYTDWGQTVVVGAGGNVGKTYTYSVWAWVPSGTASIQLDISDLIFNTYTGPSESITTTPRRLFFTSSGGAGWNADGTDIGCGHRLPLNTPVFLWGGDLQEGAFPTSYIPTTSAAVTRNADDCTLATSAIPGFSASSGSIYTEGYGSPNSASPRIVSLNTNSSNFIDLQGQTSLLEVLSGGVGQAAIAGSAWSTTAVGKIGAAFAANDFAMSFNGAAAGTDVSGTVPAITTLHVGQIAGTRYWNGHIRKLRLYNRRLSNADLVSLSATGERSS